MKIMIELNSFALKVALALAIAALCSYEGQPIVAGALAALAIVRNA